MPLSSPDRWLKLTAGLLALAGTAVGIYLQLRPPPLISLAQANAKLAAEVTEYGRHAMELPATEAGLLTDPDDAVTVRLFHGDHCVLVQWKGRDGIRTKLVMDPARERVLHQSRTQVNIYSPIFPVIEAAYAAPACNGRCQNPHPGAFREWYGARQGEWVEVWRAWPDGGGGGDGCVHVQMYNAAAGYWATNQDGTPAVRWTCCVHP